MEDKFALLAKHLSSVMIELLPILKGISKWRWAWTTENRDVTFILTIQTFQEFCMFGWNRSPCTVSLDREQFFITTEFGSHFQRRMNVSWSEHSSSSSSSSSKSPASPKRASCSSLLVHINSSHKNLSVASIFPSPLKSFHLMPTPYLKITDLFFFVPLS